MRKLVQLFIFMIVSFISLGAKEFNSFLSPKYWDLQGVYTDSLCTDTCADLSAAKGLYFNGLCVTEYFMKDGARYSSHFYSEGCKTWFSNDVYRSDEYDISGDTIRFWHNTYRIWKLEDASLILKSEQFPYRFYSYRFSEDQKTSINVSSVSYKDKVNIASYIQIKNIFFENENGLSQTFALYSHSLEKETKIRVYFKLCFQEEKLEVTNFKINKIDFFDEESNKWKELDKELFNQYSEEITNCIHHFSFVQKREYKKIPWEKVNKNCVIPVIFTVYPKALSTENSENEYMPLTLQVSPIVWQDTILQAIVLEFLEENLSSADEFIEIRGRWPEYDERRSFKLCRKKAEYLKVWLIENTTIPASKIVSFGMGNLYPLVELPITRDDSLLNKFTEIRISRK